MELGWTPLPMFTHGHLGSVRAYPSLLGEASSKFFSAGPDAGVTSDLKTHSPALHILGLECRKPWPVFSGKVGRDHQALRMMRVSALVLALQQENGILSCCLGWGDAHGQLIMWPGSPEASGTAKIFEMKRTPSWSWHIQGALRQCEVPSIMPPYLFGPSASLCPTPSMCQARAAEVGGSDLPCPWEFPCANKSKSVSASQIPASCKKRGS